MPDRRVVSPGTAAAGAAGRQAGSQSNAATRRLPQPYLFFCFVTWPLRSLIATSPHMAQLLDSPCSPSRSPALSLFQFLSYAATDRRVASVLVRCVSLLLRLFFAACCFRMLIYFFFRFLFWRPLPKQRPSALVFLFCCFSYYVFFCLHTLLLVYRTKFSSACLPSFACSFRLCLCLLLRLRLRLLLTLCASGEC